MFCNQCEQVAKGGCTTLGVCGKQADVSDLQDLLIHALQGLSLYAVEGRKVGVSDAAIGLFTCEGVFSTLTNVNFDADRLAALIRQTVTLRDELKEKVKAAGGKVDFTAAAANFAPAATTAELAKQGGNVVLTGNPDEAEDIKSLKLTLLFGLKGLAAYADHARIVGQEDDAVYGFVHDALAATITEGLSADDCVAAAMKCGEVNLRAMELLDAGNTGTYGHPVPTSVPLGAKKGKAIVVSGHDLKDLELLLKQTEGKGINVYTHGEMLPTHGYPELKKYSHFYGHYGTA